MLTDNTKYKLTDNKRLAVNTIVQYLRTIISIIVTLLSSRIILDSLGIDDFGIYSLIAGIVSMLGFIQSSLSSTTQRYISYYEGENKPNLQRMVFVNSFFLQLLISSAIVLILLFFYIYGIGNILNIPIDRIKAAENVYLLMLVILFLNFLSAPFIALLIAHENIVFYSIILLLDAVLKLPLAYSIYYVFGDKLVFFAFGLLGIYIINFFLYFCYCRKKYDECQNIIIFDINKAMIKRMLGFIGWTIYGTATVVIRTQGYAVVLNNFFSTAINAAYGIGNQVSGQLSFFSVSVLTAAKPQIMKLEGAGEREKMILLSEQTCKYSFVILFIIGLPCIIEMNALLSLWLKEVPPYAVVFCQFMVIAQILDQLTLALAETNKAIGNIKYFTIITNSFKVVSIPVAILSLYIFDTNVYVVMIIYVIFEFMCAVARLLYLSFTNIVTLLHFCKEVIFPITFPCFITTLTCMFVSIYFDTCIITFIVSFAVMSLSCFYFALTVQERNVCIRHINKFRLIKK